MIEQLILVIILVISSTLVGFWIGTDFASRRFQRELHEMIYDFDKEKREFDEWIVQRMAEIKAEQDQG